MSGLAAACGKPERSLVEAMMRSVPNRIPGHICLDCAIEDKK
jgi:hypothetical protein